MPNIARTTSDDPGFRLLVRQLDAYLAITDGDDHAFYDQFNKIDMLRHVVVVYENGNPVGCGAFKPFGHDAVEIKRMFVLPEMRGRGIASHILDELEKWAAETGRTRCVLETGKRQFEAIALYAKCGYAVMPNFGQYEGVENSVCFEKKL